MAEGVDPNVEPLKKQEEKSDEAASSTADDDVWDDTALIRAYDRAVSMAKEEVTRRMGLDKESPSGNESNASNKGRRKKKKNNNKNVNKSGVNDFIQTVDLTIECEKDVVKKDEKFSIASNSKAIKKKPSTMRSDKMFKSVMMETLQLCIATNHTLMKKVVGKGTAKKKNTGIAKKSAMGQPSTSAIGQPSTSAIGQPSTSVIGQPNTSALWQPGTSAMEQPSTSAMGQPGTSAMDQPGTIALDQPDTRAMDQPGTISMDQPDIILMDQPGTSVMEQRSPVWKPGDHCRSIYSSDGVEYEATITSINLNKGTCHVTYVGYCNMEEVRLGMLKPSIGEAARKTQVAVAQTQNGVDMDYSDGPKSPREDRMDWQHPYTQAHVSDSIHGPRPRMHPMGVPPTAGMPPMAVPPPPPPHLVASYPENDGEALSAMLMSWYMSGFHTGYYQGLRHGKNSVANGQFDGNSSRKK